MARVRGLPRNLTLDSLTLTGALAVGGGATIVGELTSESVYETLNSDKTSGAPTEDMGFRARRGASPWWVVGWDETNDRTIIGTSTDGTVVNTTPGAVVVGSVLAGDGTAAAPSYNFLSDPNTGMYSAGADALGFSAGGTLRLTVATAAVTATVPVQVPVGVASAPGLAIGASTVGIWKSGFAWTFTNGDSAGGDGIRINPSGTYLQVIAAANVLTQIFNFSITVSGAGVGSYGFATGLDASGAATTALFALGDASLRQGLAPSATPIAQTFTVGESSRPGTDTDVGGANGTIRSGLGTGTGTPSTVKIQGAVVAASGSTVQTYGTFIEGSGTTLGFYGVTPIARAVLATGAGRTVDDVITALQNLGLVKQS